MRRAAVLVVCLCLTGCHRRAVMRPANVPKAWVVVCVRENLFERRPVLAESNQWCPKHQNAVLVPEPEPDAR